MSDEVQALAPIGSSTIERATEDRFTGSNSVELSCSGDIYSMLFDAKRYHLLACVTALGDHEGMRGTFPNKVELRLQVDVVRLLE